MNIPFCVTQDGAVAGRCPHVVGSPVEWMTLRTAWRALDHVLTWETQEGAQLFADMNGGTVTPLAEVFDPSVILSPVDSKPLQE